MQLAIRFTGGQHTHCDDQDYESILQTTLERFSHRLKHVYLYIQDINGPRGGIDKQCRCVLHLRRMPPVVIQDQDEDLHALIHRVSNRAAYALSQQAGRKSRQTQRQRYRRRLQHHPEILGSDRTPEARTVADEVTQEMDS